MKIKEGKKKREKEEEEEESGDNRRKAGGRVLVRLAREVEQFR